MSNYGIRNDADLKLWFRIESIEKKIDKLGSMHSRGFNWIGFYTLYIKEVRRFLNVFAQTILAPGRLKSACLVVLGFGTA